MRNPFTLHRRDTRLARLWQARLAELDQAAELADARAFEEAMRVEPGPGIVVLGRARSISGEMYWAGMPIERFLALSSAISGASGSGKTLLEVAALLSVLPDFNYPCLIVDNKSELAELLIEIVIPALVAQPGEEALLNDLRIIRPFDAAALPALRVTQPEPHVPRPVQAIAIAQALKDALGGDFGLRMDRALVVFCKLAIELNRPLPVIQGWLERPDLFARDARDSSDPAVRGYAQGSFSREQASADALLARLDLFFALDEVRLALSAPTCLDFSACFERGITIVDLGSPPAGCENLTKFWGSLILGRLARAALSRPVHDHSPRAWLLIEEAQEVLT